MTELRLTHGVVHLFFYFVSRKFPLPNGRVEAPVNLEKSWVLLFYVRIVMLPFYFWKDVCVPEIFLFITLAVGYWQ